VGISTGKFQAGVNGANELMLSGGCAYAEDHSRAGGINVDVEGLTPAYLG